MVSYLDGGMNGRIHKEYVCCSEEELKQADCCYGDIALVLSDGRHARYKYDGAAWRKEREWVYCDDAGVEKFAVSFYDAPYRVVDRYYNDLGEAFDSAWRFGVDVVYLNSRHIDGYAATGDIFVVRGKDWRVLGIEATTDGRERYKLERIRGSS